MKKDLKGFEEAPKAKIHINSFRAALEEYRIRKLKDMKACMDFDSKNSLPSMID